MAERPSPMTDVVTIPVKRPVLRWHGGKWKLAPWILSHAPPHRVYVEPFGGAASVLMRKARSYAEVYNDLDGEVVLLFRILRDPIRAAVLRDAFLLTPFARDEFNAAYEASDDEIEQARRLVIRSFMGFGSDGTNSEWRTGFRANSNRSGTIPAHDWANYADALAFAIERLRGVIIENREATWIIEQHDSPATLHYVDPPYVHETRSKKARRKGAGGALAYRHEMTDADHARLLGVLRQVEGMVLLSGYETQLYDEALTGWRKSTTEAFADGARRRREVLWLNPQAAKALDAEMPILRAIQGAA